MDGTRGEHDALTRLWITDDYSDNTPLIGQSGGPLALPMATLQDTDVTSTAQPTAHVDEARLLDDLQELLRIPSMGGTTAEGEGQRVLADRWRSEGLDVDAWDIDLPALTADPQFPGMEVERPAAVRFAPV